VFATSDGQQVSPARKFGWHEIATKNDLETLQANIAQALNISLADLEI
jgi:hypothetical protein